MTDKDTVRESIAKHFKGALKYQTQLLEEFSKELAKDPCHAMEWADKTYMNAAHISVCKQVLSILDQNGQVYSMMSDKQIINTLCTYLMNNILHSARYGNNKSTSLSSNYMKECILAARVDAYEWIKASID